jgi:sulfur-oxidizing protein SoxA
MRSVVASAIIVFALSAHAAELHSGYLDVSPPTRAMQDDDTANPGILWVLQGEQLWANGADSCASCHGEIGKMRGVAARYPAYDSDRHLVLTIEDRIALCRAEHQHRPALVPEDDDMLALTTAVAHQSRGLPMSVATSGPLAEIGHQGAQIFTQRQGQLNLSCADCHNDLAGLSLGGSRIPQGHPNGYPLYRLEWQTLGPLERRLRNCFAGMRAAPLPQNSPDLRALEVYLAQRATGLTIETPAVRP